ncbi:nitrous oxide reductase accessory protein NosL [Massilia glaciei]|uniref:Nitrous oxide reductase accessory protein NosL n=1 Tax=Massilia glaciei TaxID=1524097 RepID=A0A2U2HIT5_9BURK|nr:nitrous oxide reductase accessory protein NosL [Massilia glaciei]PWF46726.1 nitrous oxide reductase accessory protein NosL [Massilia glaciei]
MPTKIMRRITTLAAGVLLAACGEAALTVVAGEPGADTACALDGMVLRDFPGPKAQIHYTEGKADYYCDLMELFTVLQTPEHKRKIAAIFVQDAGKTDWAQPDGHWMLAKDALFVVGSRKQGSMGPTFGAFSNARDAAAFVQKEGGKVVPFDQVTAEMLDKGGAAGDAGH